MDNFQLVVCLLVFFAPFRGLAADEKCAVAAPECKCDVDWKWQGINCESLGTITALPAFTEVETIYDWLEFRGTTLHTLPNNSFRNLKVKNLHLYEMKIRNIEPLAFAGIEYMVMEAYFSENKLSSLEGFKSLINLHQLHVRYNKLTRITASDFATFASTLQVLKLSNNKLTIADGAFASLKSLKELTLMKCQLVTLSPAVFSDDMALEKLDLSYNKLTIVDGNFASLRNLKHLNLNGCQLVTLAPTVFSEGVPLQRIWLESNNFTTIPRETFSKLKNITEINLENNQITILPTHGFADLPKFETLHLDNNIIRKIEKEAFKNLPMLKYIFGLENNHIEGNITKDMFVGLDSLTSIEFENNLITSMENLFTSLPSLVHMSVYDNPLHCDCAIAWMRSLLYSNKLSGLGTRCETPKDFEDKQVFSFPAEGCPIPTNTPTPTTTATSTTTRPISSGAKIKSITCFISLPLAVMFAITF